MFLSRHRVVLSLIIALFGCAAHADRVTVTGVATNHDSVKVRYEPVPGAVDYRIYEVSNPQRVKYAGVWHTQPAHRDEPALEVEMNGLAPGAPVTLVVEAVDALGPTPPGSLYDDRNDPLSPDCGCGSDCQCTMCMQGMCMDGMGMDGMGMLGSNRGVTPEGLISTNGQGDSNNDPNVIASSDSFTVTPTGAPALPSSDAASQVLFDTFGDGTITPVGAVDPRAGTEFFDLQTSAADWEISTKDIDTRDSSVFVMSKHFMDILFDGGTPGTNNPLHTSYGVLALSPTQTADFSGGQILHVTMEVDGRLDNRRWVDFLLTPADDPYRDLHTNGRINNTDTDVMVQIFGPNITIGENSGENDPGNPNSPPLHTSIVGAAGQATYTDSGRPRQMLGTSGFQQGRGLDNRSRFDFFVSQTHFAFYEDGRKITEHDFPVALSFDAAKVYFSHYLYHSDNERNELRAYAPWESYWIDVFPYSDERHWDNMGYEVLPEETDWESLASLVQPPAFL